MAKDERKSPKSIDQKIADLDARLARLRAKKRKRDTQAKIIVGGRLLAKARTSPEAAAFLKKLLAEPPLRDHERVVFDESA